LNSVYLSLGSNIGDREAHLREALENLKAHGVRILRQSSIYETEPQDLRHQPWFLNLAVEIETALPPAELLFYGNEVIATPELQIPHPRLGERRFVLEPLAELAPDWVHPVTGRTIRGMLPGTESQNVKRWSEE
jgi:2-amino-4-hydroxy-6-hydroxymethyldihydropteridine diphosphokinase